MPTFTAQITAAKLKQAQTIRAAIEIALGRGKQARQQRGTHDLQVFADRVGQGPEDGIPVRKGHSLIFGQE